MLGVFLCHFKIISYLRTRLTIRNREESRFDNNMLLFDGNNDDGSEERTEPRQDVSEEWEGLG